MKNAEKRPRHYAEELITAMREWLQENVPAQYRMTTAVHFRNALDRKLPKGRITND